MPSDDPAKQNPPDGGDDKGDKGAQDDKSKGDPRENELGYLKRQLQQQEKKLKDYEKAEEERKTAALSDLEKANKKAVEAEEKASQAEQRRKDALRKAEFKLAAQKAGAVDAEAAYKLADLAQVAVGDDDAVSGVDAAIEALKKSSPFLFGKTTGAVGSGAGNPGGDSDGSKKYTKEAIQRMSSEEFAKFEVDVKARRVMIS